MKNVFMRILALAMTIVMLSQSIAIASNSNERTKIIQDESGIEVYFSCAATKDRSEIYAYLQLARKSA